MSTVEIAIFVAISLLTLVAMIVVKRLGVICGPNEVHVIYGTDEVREAVSAGEYRISTEGMTILKPGIERVYSLDTTLRQFHVVIDDATSADGAEVRVECDPFVRLPRRKPFVDNAVEHFAGRSSDEIDDEIRGLLEQQLRVTIAGLSSGDLDDRLALDMKWHKIGSDDVFQEAGLRLHTLNIQRVSVLEDAGEATAASASVGAGQW